MKKAFFLFLVFTLAGCNLPTQQNPANVQGAVQTAAAQTVAVIQTEMAGTPSATPVPPTLAPATPFPSATPPSLPSHTPSPSITPARLCDKATFLGETIPDGTPLKPDQKFIKKWTLKNSGTCTWSTSYRLVYSYGHGLGGPESVPLPRAVKPGDSIELSVNLQAPSVMGTYKGFWALENASGKRFGFGEDADHAFWVEVVVGDAPEVFAVKHVTISASPLNYSGACPVKVKFTAHIETNGEGKVKYRWENSEDQPSEWVTLEYETAKVMTVTDSLEISASGSGWARINVEKPNNQAIGLVTFKVTCTE